MSSDFTPDQWFARLFGFQESSVSPSDVQKQFTCHSSPDGPILTGPNHISYKVGTFSRFNRTKISFTEGDRSPRPGTFNIISPGVVDCFEAQSWEPLNGATWQAASNYNCLEFVSSEQLPRSGVTKYHQDHTQGPFCALAAGPSIVYRNYFLPHGTFTGQLDSQINLLSETPLGPYVRNGYVVVSKDSEITALLEAPNWAECCADVGLHENCEIALTSAPSRRFQIAPKGRVVNHVYAASLDFAVSVPQVDGMWRIGRWVLLEMYQGTIMAAYHMSRKYKVLKGANKCFLTLVGGGVFQNEQAWIAEAIRDCEEIIVKTGLNVFLVCFSPADFAIMPLLKELMTNTGGKVIQTKEELFAIP